MRRTSRTSCGVKYRRRWRLQLIPTRLYTNSRVILDAEVTLTSDASCQMRRSIVCWHTEKTIKCHNTSYHQNTLLMLPPKMQACPNSDPQSITAYGLRFARASTTPFSPGTQLNAKGNSTQPTSSSPCDEETLRWVTPIVFPLSTSMPI